LATTRGAFPLETDEPDVTRDVTEGTLVEEPDELTELFRGASIDDFKDTLFERKGGGAAGSCRISPALSASVFRLTFSGTFSPYQVSHLYHSNRPRLLLTR
jgi:hypothetical protein